MPSLLTFWCVCCTYFSCIYSNFVRIILQVRAERLPVHLIFFSPSFVINAQDTPTVGTFPTFHDFQIAIINNAIVNIFLHKFLSISLIISWGTFLGVYFLG